MVAIIAGGITIRRGNDFPCELRALFHCHLANAGIRYAPLIHEQSFLYPKQLVAGEFIICHALT
jgi:hypothetical protein